MPNKQYTQPFREDLGIDPQGFHRIRMGKTIYGFKDEKVYYLANGLMTLMLVETLKSKPWILRNFREVKEIKTQIEYIAKFSYTDEDGYHLFVNGVHFVAKVTTRRTVGLDRNAIEDSFFSIPRFSFEDLKVVEDGIFRNVTAEEVSDPSFRRAFKAKLNYQRAIDRHNELFAFRYSKQEAREYKRRKYNSTNI